MISKYSKENICMYL